MGWIRLPYVDSMTSRSAISPSFGPLCTTFPAQSHDRAPSRRPQKIELRV
jgi:hypothetical protein